MKEPFFKSIFTLLFKNKNTEKSYHKALEPKIILFNKIISFFMFAISFVSAMLIWDKMSLEVRFNPQIMLIPNQVLACLFFISFILSLTIKNLKLHIWIKYFIYIMMTFTFVFLRYYTRALAEVDMIAFTIVMNFEFILRIFFVILGIFCFWEIFIMSVIVSIVFFVFNFPIFGPLYFTVYIGYYSLLLMVIIISYYYVGEKKSLYFFKKKLEINNDWYNDVLENMNNGFLCIQNKNVSFMNRTLIELIKRRFQGEKKEEIKENNTNDNLISTGRDNSNPRNNKNNSSGLVIRIDNNNNNNNNNYQAIPTKIENYLDKKIMYDYCDENSKMILNYLFNDENFDIEKENQISKETTINKESKIWIGNLSSAELLEMLKVKYLKTKSNQSTEDQLKKENSNNGCNKVNNFVLLGNKKFEFKDEDELNEKIFEISYRYYSHYDNNPSELNENDNFEFVFNDVTRTKLIEEKNAEFKYNSLFLSKIAHEFKNPLICIAELVEQTLDAYNDEKNKKNSFKKNIFLNQLKSIKSLSDYLLILIKDLDYFSQRQMDNKIEIVSSDIDLPEILNFTKDVGKSLLMKNGKSDVIKIIIEKSKEVPIKIKTDEIRLKQILINLLSNAIKFTNRGSIKLDVSLEEKIKFVVSDTGIGMTSTQMDNIFKPFKKGKDLKSINRYGSGLGLSIVYEMTHKLGSSIECYSKVGEGTKFWFFLPLILPSSTNNPSKTIIHKCKNGIFSNNKTINPQRPKSSKFVGHFDSPVKGNMQTNSVFKTRKKNIDEMMHFHSEFDLLSSPSNRNDQIENFIKLSRCSSPKNIKSDSEKESNYSLDTRVLNTIYFRRPPMANTEEIPARDSNFSQRNDNSKNKFTKNSTSTINIFQSCNNLYNNIDIRNNFGVHNNERVISNRQITSTNSNFNNFQNDNRVENRISTNNVIINNKNFNMDEYLKNLNLNNDSDCKTVIIVDDEKLTRQSTLRIIRRICTQKELKLNIIEADDGIECVYFFYKLMNDGIKISGILSDETMNYMKGSKAAQIIGEILERKGIPKVPYFILTAYEDTNTLNSLKNQYVDNVFTKPLNNVNGEKFLDSFND